MAEAALLVLRWTFVDGVLQQRVLPELVRAKVARLVAQAVAQREEEGTSQREAGVQ